MKDINLFLTELSKSLVIEPTKREKIEISISHLKKEVWGLFQNRLLDVVVFGSYDRETIITSDPESDVDIMIVFKKNEYQPDTYLKHIKEFCENKYQRSEIYSDHPSVVIELEHMKIELVPSIYNTETTVKIPAPRTRELKWINTGPQEFKSRLQAKDKNNKGLIIPIVRIFKHWNVKHGKPFSSYELEKSIIDRQYECTTIRDYYYSATVAIESILRTDQQRKSIGYLKERNRRLKVLEREKFTEYLEPELMSFL